MERILSYFKNLKYQIAKRSHAFAQNYKLKKQINTISKLFVFVLVIWLAGSLLTIISQWLFAAQHQKTIYDYLQYFWIVIIMLVSGFDVPESIHLHIVSRIISIFMLIMNLTVVALFTGQIISMFNHVLQRSGYIPEKPEKFRFNNTILICGINSKLKNIIRELKKNELLKKREIIIVDEISDEIEKFEENENIDDVWFVKGNPMNRTTLEKALGKYDNRVIILSEEIESGKFSDTNAINTAIAAEAYGDNVHTVLEITNSDNKYHFKRTQINEWICIEDYAMRLISQAALQSGIVGAFKNLMGNIDSQFDISETNRISISDENIPQNLLNETFYKIKSTLHEKSRNNEKIIIGFVKYLDDNQKKKMNLCLRNTNDFIQINPTIKPDRADLKFKVTVLEKQPDHPKSFLLDWKNKKFIVQDESEYYKVGDEQINSQDQKETVFHWVFSRYTKLHEKDKLIYITKTKYRNNMKYRKKVKENSPKEEVMSNNLETNETITKLQEIIEEMKDKHSDYIEKMNKESLKGHVIICNWNRKAEIIIEELHDESIKVKRIPIIIVTENSERVCEREDIVYQDVFTIQGDPAHEETLKRANIHSAKTVIVLADDSDLETADSKSILIALAVDNINPNAHLIVELVHSRNEKYFQYTHVDEIVCLENLAEKLLAQSALTPGLSRVYMDLMTQSEDTNEIYLEPVPKKFLDNDYTYSDAEGAIMDLKEDIILIGFSTIIEKIRENGSQYTNGFGQTLHSRKIVINPSKEHYKNGDLKNNFSNSHKLVKSDLLFMIAFGKPNL